MTSKWRASFTFPRSLDCSCRLLCWATALLPPSAANKIHTATLQGSNCNTSCSFFFFSPLLPLVLSTAFSCSFLYFNVFCKKTCLLLPLFIQVPCSHFLFFPSRKSTKNGATSGDLAYFLCCEILVYSLMSHQSVLIFTAHSHGAPAHIARMLAKLVSRFFVFACLCAVCHTAAHRQWLLSPVTLDCFIFLVGLTCTSF